MTELNGPTQQQMERSWVFDSQFLEIYRRLIQEELDRRFRGIQDEVDRRVEVIRDLMDERRDQRRIDDGKIDAELDRRVSSVDAELNRRVVALEEELTRRILSTAELAKVQHVDLKELVLTGQRSAADAVAAALDAAKAATAKAEMSSEKRLDESSEFRKTLTDQTATFIPRAEVEVRLKAVETQIQTLTERIASMELRLTTRLDRGEGAGAGIASVTGTPYEAATAAEARQVAAGAQQRAVMALVISGILLVVTLASVIFAVVKK